MAMHRYTLDEAVNLIAGDDDLDGINASDLEDTETMLKKLTISARLVRLNLLLVRFYSLVRCVERMLMNLPCVTHCCC